MYIRDFYDKPIQARECFYAYINQWNEQWLAHPCPYVKRHYYVSKVEVYNEKYDIYATFSSESAGMFHQPKYWNSKEGDLIPVVITINYFTDTNEIYSITMREKH